MSAFPIELLATGGDPERDSRKKVAPAIAAERLRPGGRVRADPRQGGQPASRARKVGACKWRSSIGSIAQWLGPQTSDPKVTGSNPATALLPEAPTPPCDGTHTQRCQAGARNWGIADAASVAVGAWRKRELVLARCPPMGLMPWIWEPCQWTAAEWAARHEGWGIRHCVQWQRAPPQSASSQSASPQCASPQWRAAHWEATRAREAAHWAATSSERQTAHAGLGRCAARWEQHHPGGSTPTELGAPAQRTLPGTVLLSTRVGPDEVRT